SSLLHSFLEAAQHCGPELGVLVDPSVMNQPDWHGVQEVQLFPAAALRDDQARRLEDSEMLHDAETCHRHAALKRAQRLTVAPEQHVKQLPARPIREGLEHRIRIHAANDT